MEKLIYQLFLCNGGIAMNEWREELKNSITEIENLKKYIHLSESEQQAVQEKKVQITPYMMNLISHLDSESGLRKQFIPTVNHTGFQYRDDYLNELEFQPVPNLIHKYKNRVIIIATNACACYCQFCTRQRVTKNNSFCFDRAQILNYIRTNKSINDVLITGGDPLICNTQDIGSLIDDVADIEHIKVIRIGTRVPITLPMRIDDELVNTLGKYNNLYINIHVNHPLELTSESQNAILRLANAGIPLGSQSVLLKGINDNAATLKELFEKLVSIKVKPYYLYQCDKVAGCENYITNPEKGIALINHLAQELSGFALPKFVIDTPDAGKKVLAPCHLHSIDENAIYIQADNTSIVYSTEELM